MRQASAFSLVELLVVITIIVTLLALLTPAMDRAIYQAELAVCAAHLDGIGTGVTTYAAGNQRAYPYRPTLAANGSWRRPNCIYDAGTLADDRLYLRDSIPLNLLLDPLCGKIDLRSVPAGNHAFTNYELWFGMSFATAQGGQGLMRIGDRLEWTDNSRGQTYRNRFSILASEEDLVEPSYDYRICSSHPDDLNLTTLQALNADGYTLSRWIILYTTPERGPIDFNAVHADGGVTRLDRVEWDDTRMARVPLNAAATPADVGVGHWIHLPRQ